MPMLTLTLVIPIYWLSGFEVKEKTSSRAPITFAWTASNVRYESGSWPVCNRKISIQTSPDTTPCGPSPKAAQIAADFEKRTSALPTRQQTKAQQAPSSAQSLIDIEDLKYAHNNNHHSPEHLKIYWWSPNFARAGPSWLEFIPLKSFPSISKCWRRFETRQSVKPTQF